MYIIYGKPNCPNCNVAKDILKSKGIEFSYVDVTLDSEAMSLLKSIGAKSVPQIFKDNTLVGGVNELKNI